MVTRVHAKQVHAPLPPFAMVRMMIEAMTTDD